jgi:hypothetical protein
MMPGNWVARVGLRLLHRDTFEMMLSPAIADLQFETMARSAARPGDYCAVFRALLGALWFDLSSDLLALKSDAETIALLTLLQTSYYTFMLVLLSGLGTGTLAAFEMDSDLVTRALSYVAGVSIACLLTSSACFWPPRRTCQTQTED